jgi:hypothetical protein
MIEVLKKMYQILLTEPHAPAVCDQLEPMLREAIAELESQEPVGALTLGGIIDTSDGLEYEGWDVEWDAKVIEALQEKLVTSDSVEVMLYTHPPQRTWVGLTDEEVDKAWRSVDYTVPWEQHRIDIARAIEAKLKEKNNG